jgi:hypothetical protein
MTRMIWFLVVCSLLMLGVACSDDSPGTAPQFDFNIETDAGDGGTTDAKDEGKTPPSEAGADKGADLGNPDKGVPDEGAPDTGTPDMSTDN